MLKVFRDNLKNLAWILWVIIAVFVLTLAVDFGSGMGQQGPGGNVAATVGDETVTIEDFRRQYQQLEGLYRQVYGEQFTPEVAQQLQLPMQALNNAVNQKILLAEAGRLGLEVTDEELSARILNEQVFKDDQGRFVGQEKYAEILRANNYSVASFEAEMRQDLLLQKLTDILRANVFVSDKEVEGAYREQVERAKIRYLQLPRSQFAQAAAQIPATEVASWYEGHKDEYRLPEQREAAYLLVEPARLADQVTIPDQELRDYYQAHQEEFSRQEQVRARHILVKVDDKTTDEAARQRIEAAKKRIEGGADFAAVAREVSEDTASKGTGGDLGYFGRGQMVPEFETAAFGAETGKMVGPVKSSFGYHLIEVSDKRPGGTQPFEEAREQIRPRLAAERVQKLAETKAKEIAGRFEKEKTKNAQTLEALSKATPGTTSGTTGKFSENGPVPGLGFAPAFNNAAFSLKKGEVSDPIQVPRGWAVLYLQEIHEPRVPPLNEVEDRVRGAVAQQRLQKLTMDRLARARQEIAGGKTLDLVAAELGLTVQETPTEFGTQGAIPGIGVSPELAKAALKLQPGQIGGPVADARGGVIFQVTERKSWDPRKFTTEKEATRSRLQQEKLQRYQASLIEQRRRELEVSFDRQLLQELGVDPDQPQQG
jgi:peptidyl-prolyl cis-trans isomerase D